MAKIINLDFETKSACDIKKAGAWRYSRDESTEVLCFAYRIDGGPIEIWSPFLSDFDDNKIPQDLREAIGEGATIHAWNSFFEFSIWNNVLSEFPGFMKLPLSRFMDTAAKAAALALPRNLEEGAKAIGLPIEKDMTGRRLMLKMSKPRKARKEEKKQILSDPNIIALDDGGFEHCPGGGPHGEKFYLWHEEPADILRLFEYCKKDVEVESAVATRILNLPWSDSERNLWLFDQRVNLRGVPIDIDMVGKALGFLAKYFRELLGELKEITNGEVTTAGQRARILAWLEKRGVVLEGLTKDHVTAALKDDSIDAKSKRVLEIRLLLGKTSTKKLESMLKCVDQADGRVRGTLLYHGASTGRWSGRLIQPQNFPRGSLKEDEVLLAFERLNRGGYENFREHYPDLLDAISSMLRGFIKAKKGREFIAADFSSIESRALFWLAKEEAGLEVYRTHGKIYEDMAGTIYNKSIDQIGKGSFERQLGKQAVLGCGYGMGGPKFQTTCEGYGMDVSKDLAKFTVSAFRAKFPDVVGYWRLLENAAIMAVKNPGKAYPANSVAFKVAKGFLWARLPSGRLLAYYKPRLKAKETPWGEKKLAVTYMGLNSQTRKWERQSTYGGKLCENVTQAVARDLMAEAMTRLEANHYPVIMTVHDEVVSEVPEGFGTVNEFELLLNTLPKWASKLPVESEGWRGKRFKK